ncbi:HAMP domain-containing sensor histidine kinase [Nocardia iowensis]
MKPPRWLSAPSGRPKTLKVRLVLAFVSASVLSALAVGVTAFAAFHDALLTNVEQQSVDDARSRIGVLAPDLTYPPDQQALDRFRLMVADATLVTYQSLESGDPRGKDLVSPELRGAVGARGVLVFQRVNSSTGPKLVIGTPVVLTGLDGARTPSGLEVYLVRDLEPTARRLDSTLRIAAGAGLLTTLAAVLLALLSVRGVLRPVRHLRDSARQLATGDLGSRAKVHSSDELADLAATFNDMAERLQRSMTELRHREQNSRQFVADVSHELRTPLTTLNAVVDVLRGDADRMTAEQRESTTLAVEEVGRLTRLVEDLLEVSRFDAGTARLQVREVDPREIVEQCLDLRQWRDLVDVSGPRGTTAVLDPRRVDVLVANLVSNALRHGAAPVRVRLTVDETTVRIEVRDSGPGLVEAAIERVFDRLYKHDSARTRSEGSGLGLAIALQHARLHGGDITAGNAADGGAVFVVVLPRYAGGSQ